MMTLEEAKKNVRGMVASMQYGDSRPLTRDWMHKGGFGWIIDFNETGIRDYIPARPWEVDAACLPLLINAARTDPYALEAAEILAKMHLRGGKPLPAPLAEFVLSWMDKPPKRKKKETPTKRARDEFASMLVGYLKRHADVVPTRNSDEKHKNSGCDLVADALRERYNDVTFNTVLGAWNKFGKQSNG
jgi:hypothetical protein